jgi:hypothetical protein
LLLGPPAQSQDEDYPVAIPTDQAGVVISPFASGRRLDVAGLDPGSLAMDPIAKEIFRIPYSSPAQRTYEDYLGNPSDPASGKSSPVSRPEAQDPPAVTRPGSQDPIPPHRYPETRVRTPESIQPSWQPVTPKMPGDLLVFLYEFNHLSSSNDPGALLPFYSDPVENYFGKKNVRHDAIYQDRAAYIQRFPQRSYIVAGDPILFASAGNILEVMIRIDYAVAGSGKSLAGTVTDSIRVRRGAGGYQIIGIEEAKAATPPAEIQRQDEQRFTPDLSIGDSEPGLYDYYQQEQLERFLEAFTASGEVNDASAGVAFMHPQIEVYYSLQNPTRRDLLNDRSRYIDRWPERRYWLTQRPRITQLSDGSWQAVSQVGYEVRNQSKYLSGVATSVLRLVYSPEGLKIVSIREE